MRIGFVGLGNMGAAMARRLIAAGHEVTGYNRSRDKAVALGGGVAERPADAAGGDLVFSVLADDHAVEQTVWGDDGILAGLGPQTVHVSSSTISVALAKRLVEAHPDGRMVCATVFGRPEAVDAGKLFVVAAGAPQAVDRCTPAFEAIGQHTFRVGAEPHHANVIKLAGNFMIASMIESLGEAFALARKNGVDAASLLEVLSGSLFNAPIVKTYGPIIASRAYDPPGFKMRLGLKDIRLALAAAEAVDVPLPLASLIRDHFIEGLAHGRGDLDWAALAEVSADAAGL